MPRQPVNLGSLNVRIITQTSQQTRLALTLNSSPINVWCTSETGVQDSSGVVQPTAPNASSRYFLCTSGFEADRAAGQRDARIVMSSKARVDLLDWIPATSRFRVIRLQGSVGDERIVVSSAI